MELLVPKYPIADDLHEHACSYCATISTANPKEFLKRAFIPTPADRTATVSFIRFEGKAYAVTAAHVADFLHEASAETGGYFLPAQTGLFLEPLFIHPPKPWTAPLPPDVAICLIQEEWLA